MENLEQFEKYRDLLAGLDYDEPSMDYGSVERHILFLKQLAAVENSSVAVVDVSKQNYIFMQSKFLAGLGMSHEEVMRQGQQMLFSLMHPDDIGFVIDTARRSLEFILDLPIEERKNYKTIYDFRLKDREGKYVRFIQQIVPLELDGRGNPWLMLMLNDIVPGKGEMVKQQRRMVHITTGKLYLFTDEDETNARSILSTREIEILGLLSKGMASKHIADELFLSVNTINNHRRRILEKTRTDSTAEAVRYAISLGLM